MVDAINHKRHIDNNRGNSINDNIKNSRESHIGHAQRLYDLEQIDLALGNIAGQLNQHFANEQDSVVILSVLKGGLVVTGQLLTKLSFNIELEYIHLTRYKGETTGSECQWKYYPSMSLHNKEVVIVDDIFDEGTTLSLVKDYCVSQGAKNVLTMVLLNKEHQRKKTDIVPDYVALTVPDVYVFGFGLDYRGHYRNAPGIYAL